ncbi:aromatic amino acid ammonia-lyase [Hymenobacter sp. ASUV-10]|uniref:Aromatic amino acid ammonia-lyase n=1 Tax=Hymenobacter aranciens TaxID=3063996 RepID=A0ABT9BC08_9BACT|nr:aromatic amino acid ammonia-lyase [Hymenobacter sp. ASUV-10]MDO7875796.1 aromatic amino acid ammonia-lyase [Hymenobacter sp. ASUV-10]
MLNGSSSASHASGFRLVPAVAAPELAVGHEPLTLADFQAILQHNRPIVLAPEALARVERSFQFLKDFAKGKLIYGINTGFGPMAQYKIADDDLNQLQYNLIRSHCSGLGNLLPPLETKALMVSRLCSLLRGYSGIHPELVQLLRELINRSILPCIYEHGGVGASGDLVQLAHLALALIGEGEVLYHGTITPAAEALRQEGLTPLTIHYREGLALLNGTSAMTGIAVVNLLKAKRLISWSLALTATINQLVEAYDDAVSHELNSVKLHTGQQQIAAALRQLNVGSALVRKREQVLYKEENLGADFLQDKVQEYYSLRCVPQILGPVQDALAQAELVVLNEVHSVNDNPIIDAENANVYHGGNFHGDYVAFEMDKLKTAITKLAMLAERQLNYLLNDKLNQKLPPFINLGKLGFNFGMQGLQFTATSTVAECQALSTPMYVHSIPNNNDNQDVVSMGTNAAVIARKVVDNAAEVLAIHATAVMQAVDYLQVSARLSPACQAVYQQVRAVMPAVVEDFPPFYKLRAVVSLINTNDLAVL